MQTGLTPGVASPRECVRVPAPPALRDAWVSPRKGRQALLCAEGMRPKQSAWRAGAGLGWALPRPGLWSGALISPPSEEQAFSANPVARSSSSEGLARAPGLSSEASLESNEVTGLRDSSLEEMRILKTS